METRFKFDFFLEVHMSCEMPKYYLCVPDPESICVDTFAQFWENIKVYFFVLV